MEVEDNRVGGELDEQNNKNDDLHQLRLILSEQDQTMKKICQLFNQQQRLQKQAYGLLERLAHNKRVVSRDAAIVLSDEDEHDHHRHHLLSAMNYLDPLLPRTAGEEANEGKKPTATTSSSGMGSSEEGSCEEELAGLGIAEPITRETTAKRRKVVMHRVKTPDSTTSGVVRKRKLPWRAFSEAQHVLDAHDRASREREANEETQRPIDSCSSEGDGGEEKEEEEKEGEREDDEAFSTVYIGGSSEEERVVEEMRRVERRKKDAEDLRAFRVLLKEGAQGGDGGGQPIRPKQGAQVSHREPLSHTGQRKRPSQTAYAHVAVIRKKDERAMLPGRECEECAQFYDAIREGGLEFDRKRFVNNCSRHRSAYAAPDTPPHFWDLSFPETQLPGTPPL